MDLLPNRLGHIDRGPAPMPVRRMYRDRYAGRITPRIIGDDTRGAWRSQDVARRRGQRSQTFGREVGGKHTGASQAQHCPGCPPTSLPTGCVFRVFANWTLRGKTHPSVRSRCPAHFPAMQGYGRTAEQDPFASRCGDNSRHFPPALLSSNRRLSFAHPQSRARGQVAAKLLPTVIIEVFCLLVRVLAAVHRAAPRQPQVDVMLGEYPKGLLGSVLSFDVVIK